MSEGYDNYAMQSDDDIPLKDLHVSVTSSGHVDRETSETGRPPTHVDTETSETGRPPTNVDTETSETGRPPTNVDTETSETGRPPTNVDTETSETGRPQIHVDTETSETGRPPIHVDTETSETGRPPTHVVDTETSETGQPPTHVVDTEASETGQPPTHVVDTKISESSRSPTHVVGMETSETGRPATQVMDRRTPKNGLSSTKEEPVQLLTFTIMGDTAPAEARNHRAGSESGQAPAPQNHVTQECEVRQRRSKQLRSYYKQQQRLIKSFEDLSKEDGFIDGFSAGEAAQSRRLASFYSKITFAVNLLLFMAKLAASILSGSMSIISSLVDSVVDLLSGIIMWWAARAIKRRNIYEYPQGRTKLEPVSIIILSVVMGMASLQLIRESGQKIGTLVTDDSSLPDMGITTFVIAGSTVVVKFVLWLVCRRVPSPIVQTLALDHRNDVMSNCIAIVCGYLGSGNFQDKFSLHGFIFADPIGAILISMYIIYNWWKAGSEQIRMLTGFRADPDFLAKVTWMAMHHDPNITHIETVDAYHFGNNFLVRVDIVLPESMPLRDAHDIGESLQQKLESIPLVERAFVHVDYEFLHKPSSEHKVV